MAKYRFTNKAVEDLSDIWEYTINVWSERQADVYYDMLIDCCQKITTNPRIYGSRYEEVAEDLYGYRANKHIIFYRILPNDDILVIRILHQKMDLKHHLTDGSN